MHRNRMSALALLCALGCEEPTATPAPSAAPSTPSPASASSPASSSSPAPSASLAAPAPTTPARPLYYERAITEEDLAGRTLRELALMRNTIYARAGNPFRRPWLDAHFRAQPWYQPKDRMDESKITDLDRDNARKIADHDAAITHEDLEKRRDEVLARQKAGTSTPEDGVELSLLSQRLGVWLGEAGSNEATPIEDHTQLDRLLKVEELSTLSRRDLRILRNTIYARHGRTFESAVVRSYFKGATWYKPRDDYHDGMLSAVDQKNIAIISSVEDSLGGPLHENPFYKKDKDSWMSAA